MLVLTRRPKESITIGSDVQVTVLEVRGSQVRLGINAPRKTPVNRTEIYELILQENLSASQAPSDLDGLPEPAKNPR